MNRINPDTLKHIAHSLSPEPEKLLLQQVGGMLAQAAAVSQTNNLNAKVGSKRNLVMASIYQEDQLLQSSPNKRLKLDNNPQQQAELQVD
jgi:hypothetical protein